MSNKMFYIKSIDENTEMCMVIGWADKEKYNIFLRDKKTGKILKDIGSFEPQEAWSIFEGGKVV